ncbi:MAG: DUF5654 family protein [Nanoarchaeota archaeon]
MPSKKLKTQIKNVKKEASNFKKEFKKQTFTAISAALGFLIALSWREPISDLITKIVEEAGLTKDLIRYKFLSAIIITVICVLFLIIISKWSSKN